MATTPKTITKKELIDRIADMHGLKRVMVKKVIQTFLDEIITELADANRLEFRDFGVFESKIRAARQAQNPKTMAKVHVPPKRTVKFKIGRVMKMRLLENPCNVDEATGLPLEPSSGLGTPVSTDARSASSPRGGRSRTGKG